MWLGVSACARAVLDRFLGVPRKSRNATGQRQLAAGASARQSTGRSKGLFEDRLVSFALWRRPMTVEIGIERLEGVLAAIVVLEFELAVLNDSGAVQHAARLQIAR